MLLKAEATSAASIRCVCLISNTEIKRSISVCLNWIEKHLQGDWISTLSVCVCLCCNLCIRWLVGGWMDGFEGFWMCACVCLLIELGVLKGLRGVCNRVCSYSTPVAARRRLMVCTGAGVCLMWSTHTSQESATHATTHALSQTHTTGGRERETRQLIPFPEINSKIVKTLNVCTKISSEIWIKINKSHQ